MACGSYRRSESEMEEKMHGTEKLFMVFSCPIYIFFSFFSFHEICLNMGKLLYAFRSVGFARVFLGFDDFLVGK